METKETPKKYKLPGGPLEMKPIEINGVHYDPFHPPKLFLTPEGKQEYRGGKVIDRDEAYSMMFWFRNHPKGLKEAMMNIINSAAEIGGISHFVGATKTAEGKFQLDQVSKERLSAFRILAKEMGYVIGPYRYDEKLKGVQASISKAGIQDQG